MNIITQLEHDHDLSRMDSEWSRGYRAGIQWALKRIRETEGTDANNSHTVQPGHHTRSVVLVPDCVGQGSR